jgi:hypothetical protein
MIFAYLVGSMQASDDTIFAQAPIGMASPRPSTGSVSIDSISTSASSVATLIEGVTDRVFGWARNKSKKRAREDDEDASLDYDQGYRLPPALRAVLPEVPVYDQGEFAMLERAAQASQQHPSRKRARDWEEDEESPPDDVYQRPMFRAPLPPPYSECARNAGSSSSAPAPPSYLDCQPPSKRARHVVAPDWKSSVMDSLSRPVANAGPQPTSYFVVNAVEFEKHGYSLYSEPMRAPSETITLAESAATAASGLREKLAAIVTGAGEWIETLRHAPEGERKLRPTEHPGHVHREPGKWTSRVTALWKRSTKD